MAFRARKDSVAFEKRAPGRNFIHNTVTENASCLLHLALRLELTHKFGLAVDFFAPNK